MALAGLLASCAAAEPDDRDPAVGGYETGKSGAQISGEARARATLRERCAAGVVSACPTKD